MASGLLRRQLARNISVINRRLLSSTSSALAQVAPQGPTTATGDSKNEFKKHIAEDLQGIPASEILAESGTRKDAQMRHFTGEDSVIFPNNPMTDNRSSVNFG
jgi:NADH dehydrogenase (ubiquinone) Fe-S protein 2